MYFLQGNLCYQMLFLQGKMDFLLRDAFLEKIERSELAALATKLL